MTDVDKSTGVHPPRHASESEIQETKQELKQAIHGSHEVLATATTVFPFTLFPDTVTLDRAKLNITKRSFVSTAEVMSIRIEDILNVTASVGPVFGSLHIVSREAVWTRYEVRYGAYRAVGNRLQRTNDLSS